MEAKEPSYQEIFDKTVERLYDGKGQAKSPYGNCCYIKANGEQCAVGIWLDIKDDLAGSVHTIARTHPELCPDWFQDRGKRALLRSLQSIHDEDKNWHGFRPAPRMHRKLFEITTTFGLKSNSIIVS